MSTTEAQALEQQIQAHCQAEAWEQAATAAIKGYGPEILGYLTAAARSETDATEAFSMFCEDLWKGLHKFRWAASFRTWAYTLARNALRRLQRDPRRLPGRNVAISQVPAVLNVAQHVRTSTLVHLRTEVKDKFAALRADLSEEDRTLLILRVDRDMSWQSIAAIMSESDKPDPQEVRRASATLRKRFERVKERLRKLALQRGLLER